MNDQPAKQSEADSHPLRTSRYDRASSWLLSLLIAVGLLVLVLLVSWYSQARKKPVPPRDPQPPTTEIVLDKSRAIPLPVGGGRQLDRPSDEAQAAEKADENMVRDLAKLDEAAKKATKVDERTLSKDNGIGIFGDRPGDKRGGGDPGGIPRRWEVQFNKTSLSDYARQLDFFHIELAVLLPDGRLAYARNLSKPKPEVRYVANAAEKEKRYYLTWRKGELQEADRKLLARAGIEAGKGMIILKFLPPQVEASVGGPGKRPRRREGQESRSHPFRRAAGAIAVCVFCAGTVV